MSLLNSLMRLLFGALGVPTDGQILKYNASAGRIEWASDNAGGSGPTNLVKLASQTIPSGGAADTDFTFEVAANSIVNVKGVIISGFAFTAYMSCPSGCMLYGNLQGNNSNQSIRPNGSNFKSTGEGIDLISDLNMLDVTIHVGSNAGTVTLTYANQLDGSDHDVDAGSHLVVSVIKA